MIDNKIEENAKSTELSLKDLEKLVKDTNIKIEDQYRHLTVFVANYKRFKESVDKRFETLDADSRKYEQANTKVTEAVVADITSIAEESEDNIFVATMKGVIEADFNAREKAIIEKIQKLNSGVGSVSNKKSSNGLLMSLMIANIFAVAFCILVLVKIGAIGHIFQ